MRECVDSSIISKSVSEGNDSIINKHAHYEQHEHMNIMNNMNNVNKTNSVNNTNSVD
jgi:hypothetical protein